LSQRREVATVSDRERDRDEPGESGADLPADVEATLLQLLAAAAADARCRDVDAVTAVVDTVSTVSRNKLPDGVLRDRLLHGCRRVDRLVADEPLVAAEYLEAMERLVDGA
jgi:hypothetical protein